MRVFTPRKIRARLRYRLAEACRRINVNDLWIAAVALANGLPVATQDRDYGALDGLGGPDCHPGLGDARNAAVPRPASFFVLWFSKP
ncbi:PIN domain-containing protein [Arthrobacter crystallopoietes]|uniref:PIN domain-containing protein n=1 Tax=Crystallibacter crystallopoietes TaxID=37928 RepID=UPI003D64F69E